MEKIFVQRPKAEESFLKNCNSKVAQSCAGLKKFILRFYAANGCCCICRSTNYEVVNY